MINNNEVTNNFNENNSKEISSLLYFNNNKRVEKGIHLCPGFLQQKYISEIKDQNQFKKIQNNKTINNVNDKNQNGLKINKIIGKTLINLYFIDVIIKNILIKLFYLNIIFL